MKLFHLLLLLAGLALLVPFVLAATGRDNYADNEGMSAADWKRLWTRLRGKPDGD